MKQCMFLKNNIFLCILMLFCSLSQAADRLEKDPSTVRLLTTQEKLKVGLDTVVYTTVVYTVHCAGASFDAYLQTTLGKGYFRSFPNYNLDIGSVAGTIIGTRLAHWTVHNMHVFGDPIANSTVSFFYTIGSAIKSRTEEGIKNLSKSITTKIDTTGKRIETAVKSKTT